MLKYKPYTALMRKLIRIIEQIAIVCLATLLMSMLHRVLDIEIYANFNLAEA